MGKNNSNNIISSGPIQENMSKQRNSSSNSSVDSNSFTDSMDDSSAPDSSRSNDSNGLTDFTDNSSAPDSSRSNDSNGLTDFTDSSSRFNSSRSVDSNRYFGEKKTLDRFGKTYLVPLIIDNAMLLIPSDGKTTQTSIDNYKKIVTIESLIGKIIDTKNNYILKSVTSDGLAIIGDENSKTKLKYSETEKTWFKLQISPDLTEFETITDIKSDITSKLQPSAPVVNTTDTTPVLKSTARRTLFIKSETDKPNILIYFTPDNIKKYNENLKINPNATITDENNNAHDISTLNFFPSQCIINIGALANSIRAKLTAPPTSPFGKIAAFFKNSLSNTKYTRDANGFFKETTHPQARLANLYLSIYKYIFLVDKSKIEKYGNGYDLHIFASEFNKNIKEIKGVEFIRTDRVFKSLTGGSKKNRFSKKRKNHTNNL